MARKDQVRRQRSGTVINATSKQQETDLVKALNRTASYSVRVFGYGCDFRRGLVHLGSRDHHCYCPASRSAKAFVNARRCW